MSTLPGYHVKDEYGGTDANVQHLREAAKTERAPSLEAEPGGWRAERGTGRRAPSLGMRRELHTRGPCYSARLRGEEWPWAKPKDRS